VRGTAVHRPGNTDAWPGKTDNLPSTAWPVSGLDPRQHARERRPVAVRAVLALSSPSRAERRSLARRHSCAAFGPRMVCTRCGIIGADGRPNWKEQPDPRGKEDKIKDLTFRPTESRGRSTGRRWSSSRGRPRGGPVDRCSRNRRGRHGDHRWTALNGHKNVATAVSWRARQCAQGLTRHHCIWRPLPEMQKWSLCCLLTAPL
jgi:hypothetical protein